MAEIIHLTTTPCNIFLVRCPDDSGPISRGWHSDRVLTQLFLENDECEFRGVSFDRLGQVLEHGIDVSPTDEVIFAADPHKAFEYGNWPKLILALRRNHLKRTFKEVSAQISNDELEVLQLEFPTIMESVDGTKLWCSRLKEEDPRIATPYETGYAWWIPGDPWQALKAVFLLARPQDTGALAKFCEAHNPVGGNSIKSQ